MSFGVMPVSVRPLTNAGFLYPISTRGCLPILFSRIFECLPFGFLHLGLLPILRRSQLSCRMNSGARAFFSFFIANKCLTSDILRCYWNSRFFNHVKDLKERSPVPSAGTWLLSFVACAHQGNLLR